jgi:hypothetical protein
MAPVASAVVIAPRGISPAGVVDELAVVMSPDGISVCARLFVVAPVGSVAAFDDIRPSGMFPVSPALVATESIAPRGISCGLAINGYSFSFEVSTRVGSESSTTEHGGVWLLQSDGRM